MPRLLYSPLRSDSSGLGKRTLPKIAGSESAFIALIVGLSAVIMFSCVAVYFLIRNHASSDEDRALHYHTRRRRQRPPVSTSTTSTTMPYNYTPPAVSPRAPTRSRWSLFGRRTSTDPDQNHAAKPGWFGAGSGDWDVEYDEGDGPKQSRGMDEVRRSPPIAQFTANSVAYAPISRSPPVSMPVTTPHRSSSPAFPTIPVPVRSSSPEPIPGSVEGTETLCHKEERKDTGQSRLSLWTFEGGTKFIESL